MVDVSDSGTGNDTTKKLSAHDSKIVITLGLLGFFLCIVSLFLLSDIRNVDFRFPLDKNEVLRRADAFLDKKGIARDVLVHQARISSDENHLIYLQKIFPQEAFERLLPSLPLYYWRVDYLFEKEDPIGILKKDKGRLLYVCLEPIGGNVIGFQRRIPTEASQGSPVLSKDECLRLANEFLTSIGFDIEPLFLSRYSLSKGRCILEWSKALAEHDTTTLTMRLEIIGDEVSSFAYFLETPAKFFKQFQSRNIFDFGVFFVLNIFVFGFGIFTFIVSIIKRKEIRWKDGLWCAFFIVLSHLVNFLIIGEGYRGALLVYFVTTTVMSGVLYFLWTLVVYGVAQFFGKEARLTFEPISAKTAIVVSYIFVFSGFGVTLFFFSLIAKVVKPVSLLGFYTFFSSFRSLPVSCVMPVLLSLGAAVAEELFFRALLISFLKKFIKKISWCIVAASLVWSFIHVSPFGMSDIAPGFLKGVFLVPIGILFGYIFVRFGLVCAITTHYLYDLVVIGSAFLEFTNFRNANETVLVLLIAAVAPALIALGKPAKKQLDR